MIAWIILASFMLGMTCMGMLRDWVEINQYCAGCNGLMEKKCRRL